MNQIGNRANAGDLHLFVDCRGTNIKGAAEDIREAQGVVDLIGEV